MARSHTNSCKPRNDTGFNPFMEAQKIIGFCKEAAQAGSDIFSVIVKDGMLEWTKGRVGKKYSGFIAVIDNQKFGNGLTTKQWRKLEEKVAIEMCKQRKAW